MFAKVLLLIAILHVVFVTSYVVERNVRDYGAKGDGVTDDTAAIIKALTEERGSDPKAVYPNANYPSSTKRPAYVYFPAGVYKITQTLPLVYYTQMVGQEDNLPTLKMVSPSATVIESKGSWYQGASQNNFYRQIRNFIIDMEECVKCNGINWPVAQATSISNIFFKMGKGSQNQGIFMGDGSGGFLSDLTFEGGKFGMWVGNQQFTARNITIRDASVSGIFLNWDWLWTFVGLTIQNCPIGIDVLGHNYWKPEGVGSVIIVDAKFENCTIGIQTHFDLKTPLNTLVLNNVQFSPAGALVRNNEEVVLKQGGTVKSWVQGRIWKASNGTFGFLDLSATVPPRPKVLAPFGTNFFQKARPSVPASSIVNVVKDLGFVIGSDITKQLNAALKQYQDKKTLLFPHGIYYVTDTVYVPPGSRIMGQVWSVFSVSGPNFNDPKAPKAVFQVGNRGEKGMAQFIDILFTTKGPHPGAKIIEWNMGDPMGQPGACGMWDTHFRIGGAADTDITPKNCPANDGGSSPADSCNGVWGMMHITSTGTCYLENNWLWTADHHLEADEGESQINVYTARGFLIESQGPVWMYGTASEHNYLYQYAFVNASNVLMGAIQTETPYYQPSAKTPFAITDGRDPSFCTDDVRCNMAYALYIKDSSNIYTFGTGLYSFFNVWSQGCLSGQPHCQLELVKVVNSKQLYTHAFSTYGSVYMKTRNEPYSLAQDQDNTFCSTASIDLNFF